MAKRMVVPRFFFFFNDTATTEIYTLSLHDALPICSRARRSDAGTGLAPQPDRVTAHVRTDRNSTRLNSSHLVNSYAVFCWKKKNSPALTRICSTYHEGFTRIRFANFPD